MTTKCRHRTQLPGVYLLKHDLTPTIMHYDHMLSSNW